jgi:hypothetical protein
LRLALDAHHRCPFEKVVEVLRAAYKVGVDDVHLQINGRPFQLK